ncbi:Uncharacterised protein [Clostridium putrefaciens]|uniref:Uncharacterized protein n=1 Tax=Clostridium putrefaciens TaxID=99675 RepID=A0A381J8T2_9CLOT|nr:hypothetical protein [Clostridium putrefaciens]SUY47670.1 Uncharacterised protein [Clostridium putrefaciens]
MKKRSNLIIICLIVIIIAATGTSLYKHYLPNIDSNNYLSSNDESERSFDYHGNEKSGENTKSFDFEKFNGKWSLIQFTSNKGNKININDNTKISKGNFYIVILDSEHNIIAKKNELKDNGNINFTTPKDGKYTVRIIGANASGNFNISISASNNINVSHIDLFN